MADYDYPYVGKPKAKVDPVQRQCLRCGLKFRAPDRFTRLCSPHCKEDNGGIGPGGGSGKRVEARVY